MATRKVARCSHPQLSQQTHLRTECRASRSERSALGRRESIPDAMRRRVGIPVATTDDNGVSANITSMEAKVVANEFAL